MKVKIRHWQYDDGSTSVFDRKSKSFKPSFSQANVGWRCWAYTDDNTEFKSWMDNNMTGDFECTPRYNSGDPMNTVHISEEEDATMFKLKWM